MNPARIFFAFIFLATSLTLSAQYHPVKKKFVFRYWTNTVTDDHGWNKKYYAFRRIVDFSHADTILYPGKRSTVSFTKVSTTKFDNEPKTILSFHLVGIYRDSTNLQGLFILFYLDEKKGLLRKYYFAPGRLMNCDYATFTPTNPFSQLVWPQSMNDTITIKKTFQVN